MNGAIHHLLLYAVMTSQGTFFSLTAYGEEAKYAVHYFTLLLILPAIYFNWLAF